MPSNVSSCVFERGDGFVLGDYKKKGGAEAPPHDAALVEGSCQVLQGVLDLVFDLLRWRGNLLYQAVHIHHGPFL